MGRTGIIRYTVNKGNKLRSLHECKTSYSISGTEYLVQKEPEATKNHQGVERDIVDKKFECTPNQETRCVL